MPITQTFTRTLPNPSATHNGFVFLLSTGWFTQADGIPRGSPIDGGTYSLANGGGDLQAYSDEACTVRVPVHVVEFVTGVSPVALVKLRLPTWTAGDKITIAKNDAQTVQPPVTDLYGQYAVYQDYTHTIIGSDDVTGNSTTTLRDVTQTGSIKGFPALESSGLSGDCLSIDGSDTEDWTGDFYLSAWVNLDSYDSFSQIVGIRSSAQWEFSWRLETDNPSVLIGSSSPESTSTISLATDYYLSVAISGTTISYYINGALTDTKAISGTRVNRAFELAVMGMVASGNDTGLIGRVANVSALNGSVVSSEYILDSYTNQNDPDNFGTSSEWADFATGGISIDIDTGLLSLIGSDLGLTASRSLTAESGIMSLSGDNISLLKSSIINLDTGVLSFIGGALSITKDNAVFIGGGSLSLTGGDVDIIYTPAGGASIDLDTGLLSLVGSDLSLSTSRIITTESGDITLNGSPLSLSAGKSILIDTGNMTLNGSSLEILKSSAIDIDSGDLSLTGSPVQLTYSGFVSLVIDDFSLSYTTDTIGISYTQDLINLNYE